MAERKRITLLYSYNDNWIGGTYYILNIIKSLKLLNDELKPEVTILHDKLSAIDAIERIKYPYLNFATLNVSLPVRVANKFAYKLNGKLLFKVRLPDSIAENVYPLTDIISTANIKKGLYWIPDFQDYHMPQLFSKVEARNRKASHEKLVSNKNPIVFSSKTAAQDFDTFYPNNKNPKYILNFASFIDSGYMRIDIEGLLDKYKITKPYFIVSNQFWTHKNHIVVLEAVKRLKNHASEFQVVFTGKEHDHRNPDYFKSLDEFIKNNEIQDSITSLGFIERNDQLQLMAHSLSIIQPSLFEGWSTVVEDAKVINKHILVSDIPLHREQISTNCDFFDPFDSSQLADRMLNIIMSRKAPEARDYSIIQQQFAENFINLF